MSRLFHDEALDELIAAASWYEAQRYGLGSRFLHVAHKAINAAANDPQRFSRLETYLGSRDIRRCNLTPFSYLAIYEIFESSILVLAIAHSRRQPNYWLRRVL